MRSGDGPPQTCFEADEPFSVEIHFFEVKRRLHGARFNLSLSTLEGEIAFVATDHLYQFETLEPGEISVDLLGIRGQTSEPAQSTELACILESRGDRMLIDQADYLEVTIGGSGNQATIFPDSSWPGVVCPKVEWQVEHLAETAHARSVG